jgi:hypothetical protein
MPATLTFDQAGVQPDHLEYQWAVDIDSSNAGSPDLRAAVTHFRRSGAAETRTGDVLAVTQQDLWNAMGATSTATGVVDVTLTGNVFRFEVDVTEDARLAQVTSRSQSTWTTYYQFGPAPTDLCEDSLR